MKAPRPNHEAGIALIVVLLVTAMLMALAVGMTTAIVMDSSLRGAFQRTTTGFYAAESGLNRGMGDYRNIFLNFNVPTGSDFALHTITVGKRTVNYQIAEVPPNPQQLVIPAGQLFGGLTSTEYNYLVNSTAVANNETEASVNAQFKVGNIPIFQFVAFYSKDLEIAPGANMTLNGRIHTNGSLYLSADGATLLVGDNPPSITTVQVSAKKDIYRGRKRASACENPGTVTVDMLQDTVAPIGRLDPQNLNCSGSATRLIPVSELATWKGSMVSQIKSIAVPEPGLIANSGGQFWTRADLRIVLNLNKTWTPDASYPGYKPLQYVIEVQDVNQAQDVARTALLRQFMLDTASSAPSFISTRPIFYTDVPVTAGGTCNQTAACYVPIFASNNRVYGTGALMTADSDFRRGGFYNFREAAWMYLLNVNVRALLTWNAAQPVASRLFDPADTTDGGIVLFLTVKGPGQDALPNNYGVRVFGSPTLPFPAAADPTGITIVSDQAVYVAGNFNTPTTVATGWQPTSIMGDSINILSQNWFADAPGPNTSFNDRQSNLPLASRVAANTVINTAFIGGVDDTIPGGGTAGYNGGLENYPRFHENWSGQQLNYLGSFVSLGNPDHVNGPWSSQSYNPPTRVWNYDAQFNSAANLPPLTPHFVYVQQVLFTESFK